MALRAVHDPKEDGEQKRTKFYRIKLKHRKLTGGDVRRMENVKTSSYKRLAGSLDET